MVFFSQKGSKIQGYLCVISSHSSFGTKFWWKTYSSATDPLLEMWIISFYQWFFIPFLALHGIILFDKYPEIVWNECIMEFVVQLLGNKKHIYDSSFGMCKGRA